MASESIQDNEEIGLMVCAWIRMNIELSNETQIPITIKKMVSDFTKKCFKSKILNIHNDLDLIKILTKELSNKFIKICDLIYRASDSDFDYEKFHDQFDEEKYENLAGNVVLIKTEMGSIFGGFTSKSWNAKDKEEGQITDKHAFLFLLKSDEMNVPVTFKLKEYQQSHAIYCYKDCGPIFGEGHDIFIGKFTSCSLQSYYNEESSLSHDPLIRSFEGNGSEFDLEDFEVFGLNK